MKKQIILGLIAGAAILSGCDDFLDENRYPLDKQTDNPAYWTSKVNVQSQVNMLYGNFTGYGSGASWVNDFYYRSLSDDQCSAMESGSGMTFAKWTYQYAPASNSVWDASYQVIRRCNYIIHNSNVPNESENNNFIAQARLIRAMQYYELVRALGDVPLVEKVLNPDSPEVYGERTPRNTVMDFVLEDLNYAVENILTQSSKIEFSIDMANAMKSEICLYEAAFSKYHKNDNTRADKFYKEVINACNAIMAQGYSICDDYRSIYNSICFPNEGNPVLNNPEIIFMKGYKTGSLTHSAASFLSSETPIAGMTKDAFDSYLFKDAKPLCSTTLDKSDKPVIAEDGTFDISAALAVRDGRLAQTIDSKLAFGTQVTFSRPNSAKLQSTTGYTICKYVNPTTPYQVTVNAGNNTTCAPIYWLAYTYCDYLEARAELGQLNDADVLKCVKPLWERAGITTANLSKAYLESMNDTANNMGVSSLLWEIRRLRRSELMFDRNHRYWDLVRWHKLDLLDTTKPENANIVLGANVTGATAAQLKDVYTNGDNYINAARTANGLETRVFTDREYLQPLGTTIINLYDAKGLKLEQNPGWK